MSNAKLYWTDHAILVLVQDFAALRVVKVWRSVAEFQAFAVKFITVVFLILLVKYCPRFFDRVGHETKYAFRIEFLTVLYC